MRVTAKRLERARACKRHVTRFKRTFPNGCVLNRENIVKAAKAGLDIEWAVNENHDLLGLTAEQKMQFYDLYHAAQRSLALYRIAPFLKPGEIDRMHRLIEAAALVNALALC